MTSRKRRACWLVFVLSAMMLLIIYGVALLPAEHRISTGEAVRLQLSFPANLVARLGWWQAESKENWPVATKPGQMNLHLRLLGVIPLKTVVVQIVDPPRVVPCGQSIGVLLKTSGAVVVGFAPVISSAGRELYPAREAGVLLGDTITRINGQAVNSNEQVSQLVDKAGRDGKRLRLQVSRNGNGRILSVKPGLCRQTGRYRIGLYIRDSAAGVGTMTFYMPNSRVFGALGHMVVDAGGGEPLTLADGRIVEATIQGVQQGRRGAPGEKIGMFLDGSSLSGNIKRNTRCGIFGELDRPPSNLVESIPVALAHQIRPGPAEILTVVNGVKVERFSIQIERVMPNGYRDGKGLVVRVDDPRLLSLTGGIVQGMSGSPIMKDGMLIGAITHVFVQDPTRGYGVLAEWMLVETGLFNGSGVEKPKGLAIAS